MSAVPPPRTGTDRPAPAAAEAAATLAGTAPAAAGAAAIAGTPRRARRWHRAAIPFLLLLLLYLVAGFAHAAQEPDLGDAGTLSPTGAGPDGSSRLADLLAAKGVTIRRVTSSAEALDGLDADQPSTVFVPAPELIDPRFLQRMTHERGGHRLVLVRPGQRAAYAGGLFAGPARWAARSAPPRCDTDFAVAAGAATVLRSRYLPVRPEATVIDCYSGALVGVDTGGTETVAIGASDPFRNSRIDEVGNAALATALLSRDREVIWVDLHRAEPRPVGRPDTLSLPDYEHPDRLTGGANPFWAVFPPALRATLVLLFALAVLVALVRGRRLGPPVAEPLPVVVPATETVTGRGRLYQRIRSRTETLEVLRSAALRRMSAAIDPTGPAGTDDQLVTRIAGQTGIPPYEVHAILHPPPPGTDEELQHAVARLDALAATVLRIGTRRAGPPGSVGPGSVNPEGAP